MDSNILVGFISGSNQTVILFCLVLAVFRIYLALIDFDFTSLPLAKQVAKYQGKEKVEKFHRMGLFFSIGYVLLFAPGFLLL